MRWTMRIAKQYFLTCSVDKYFYASIDLISDPYCYFLNFFEKVTTNSLLYLDTAVRFYFRVNFSKNSSSRVSGFTSSEF